MLVCHCNGVSDRAIRKAVREGAASVGDVGFSCGAGTCCGGCVDSIQEILHTESTHLESAPASPTSAVARGTA